MCVRRTCVQCEHMRLALVGHFEESWIGSNRLFVQVGTYLRDALLTLAQTHTMIGDIRGSGLFVVMHECARHCTALVTPLAVTYANLCTVTERDTECACYSGFVCMRVRVFE